MKVTEQVDAMEASAVNPYKFLVATRVLACMLMLPLLTLVTDFFGIVMGWVANMLTEPISLRLFIRDGFKSPAFRDFLPSTLKTIVFDQQWGNSSERNLLIPNNSVWNREFAKPSLPGRWRYAALIRRPLAVTVICPQGKLLDSISPDSIPDAGRFRHSEILPALIPSSVASPFACQRSRLTIAVTFPITSASIPFLNCCVASRPPG